jgi:hypothetical protein
LKKVVGEELTRGLMVEVVSGRESGDLALGMHGTGEVLEDRDRLNVEVPKHGVALPPAQEADEIAVDPGSDESHGAGGAESLDGDVERVVVEEDGGLLEEQVDRIGRDTELAPPVLFIVTVDGGVRWGQVAAEMQDSPREGADWTEDGVTAGGVPHFLATVGVLLVGEF